MARAALSARQQMPFTSSAVELLLAAWRAQRFQLVVSEHILDELARVFQTRYFRQRLSYEQIAHALQLLRTEATITEITIAVGGVAPHPEDDLVLATAASAWANYLVTGDRELRDLSTYQGTKLVTAAEMLRILDAT